MMKFAVVSNTSSNDASIIDVANWKVVATIPVRRNQNVCGWQIQNNC